jgi:hypothetical protein
MVERQIRTARLRMRRDGDALLAINLVPLACLQAVRLGGRGTRTAAERRWMVERHVCAVRLRMRRDGDALLAINLVPLACLQAV